MVNPNTDLKSTLSYIQRTLSSGIESLDDFRALNPDLELYYKLLSMVQGMGMEMEDKSDSVLGELSSIPDSFSQILDDVNLTVSSKDEVVTVTLISCVPETQGQSFSFSDSNFVIALLKAFNYVRTGNLNRQIYFQTRLNSFSSGSGSTTVIQLTGFSDTYLEFDYGNDMVNTYPVDEMDVGYTNSLFTVEKLEDNHLYLSWNSPFIGKLSLIGK